MRVPSLFFLVVLAAVNCGGDRSPAGPSGDAVLAISDFQVSAAATSTGFSYTVQFTVRETTGRAGAAVTNARLTFFRAGVSIGATSFDDPLVSSILPGGHVTSRPLITTDDRPGGQPATRAEILITYVDDVGVTGTLTAVADIPSRAAPGLSRD